MGGENFSSEGVGIGLVEVEFTGWLVGVLIFFFDGVVVVNDLLCLK